jgi:quinol monooxygenase YgiN
MPEHRPITVAVIFEARPGKEAELKHTLLALILPTRKELGCINYDMHVCPQNPAKFFFYENWSNKKSYFAHHKSRHVMASEPWVAQLCASAPEVNFWEKIS